jgi:HK97 family phage major capsid protein
MAQPATLPNITNNRTLLAKADLALADLLTDGGALLPAQAVRFLRVAIKEQVLMPMVSAPTMASFKQQIDKIRFAGRVLRAGESAKALSEADRSKPDLSKVELDVKLFKAEVRLNNETLEDSLERASFGNTVMQEMGKAVGRDMEEVTINGDTASGDAFLAQLDGILKLATSNVVDAASAKLNKTVLKRAIKAMPDEFLRDRGMMKFITHTDAEADYADSLADRATNLGDAQIQQQARVGYRGITVVPVPLFPETLGAPAEHTDVIFTDPRNINVGIWRKITLETDKDISAGELIVVVTLRFDVKFAVEEAVVKVINVKVTD